MPPLCRGAATGRDSPTTVEMILHGHIAAEPSDQALRARRLICFGQMEMHDDDGASRSSYAALMPAARLENSLSCKHLISKAPASGATQVPEADILWRCRATLLTWRIFIGINDRAYARIRTRYWSGIRHKRASRNRMLRRIYVLPDRTAFRELF